MDNFKRREKEKEQIPSFYKKIEKRFLQYCFYDTSLLFKLLYHKYFLREIYEEIKNTNLKSLKNLEKANSLKTKMTDSVIFPSKILCEENLRIEKRELAEEEINDFEKEKISKEFLSDYIKLCKFNWSNNFSCFCFLTGVGLSCLLFKLHKGKRRISNNMMVVIGIQFFLIGVSLFHIFTPHQYEQKLKEIYSEDLQKYKLIFKE